MTVISNELVLFHRTDYDETPQRDFNHPGYKALYKTAGTSITSETASIKQHISAPTSLASSEQQRHDTVAEKTPITRYGYYSSDQKPIIDVTEKPKQDLLLGDDYKLSPADEPYDSCLPYPINLFYPTVATQTNSSDFVAAQKLWSMVPPRAAIPHVVETPRRASPVVESFRRATPLTIETSKPISKSSKSSKEESSTDSSLELKDNTRIKSVSFSGSSGDHTNVRALSITSVTQKVEQEIHLNRTSSMESVNNDMDDRKSEMSSSSVLNAVEEGVVGAHRQSLNSEDDSEAGRSYSLASADEDVHSLADNEIISKEPSSSAQSILSGRKKSCDSAFEILCRKLDKKYSSSPTNSQLVYVQQVVQDLDK